MPMSDSGRSQSQLSQWIESTATNLVVRAKAHDEQAWRNLVRLYTPLIASWCANAGLSAEDSGDVLQEVFRSVWTAIDRFRYESPDDTFRGWLRVITRNKVRDHFRRQQNSPKAGGGTEQQMRWQQVADPFGESADSESDRRETTILLRRSLELVRNEFEDRTWQAFWHVAVDGRSADQTAQELGMSRAAVYQAKSRVLQRLRKVLGGEDFPG